VDFYAGAVYHLLGIPEDMFVCMFAMGRMPGWIAQVLEQWRDNVLIRPRLKYTGPKNLAYVPVEQRG
jgi:citrate synthase